jgi:hypothetical protein
VSKATLINLFIELAKLAAVLLQDKQPVRRARDLRTSEEAKQRVRRKRRAALGRR